MKMIDVLHMPRRIWLGRKTEQNFRPIAFDVYKWLSDYPEATVSIVYTRPDGQVFPVASSDRSPIIWIPQQDVTAVSGEGEIELHLVGGGSVGISASTKTLIDDSASSAQPTAPSWVDQVVQDVTEQADRAEEAADSIGSAIGEAVAEAVPTAVADYIEEHPIEVTETAPFEIPISDDMHGNYTTTATAQEIYDNAENCVIVFGAREYVPTVYRKDTTNESIMIVFANSAKSINNTLNFMGLRINAQLSPERVTVIVSNDYLAQLPAVTASDNGKFLRVVSGAWAAETVPAAEGSAF